MSAKPLADNGSDVSTLVMLARLREARRLKLVGPEEREELLERLQEPEFREVAELLLGEDRDLNARAKDVLSAVNRLAGVEE